MILEAATAALICLDPGHGTPPAIGRQTEPIGPGSSIRKIKDGGGASGDAGSGANSEVIYQAPAQMSTRKAKPAATTPGWVRLR